MTRCLQKKRVFAAHLLLGRGFHIAGFNTRCVSGCNAEGAFKKLTLSSLQRKVVNRLVKNSPQRTVPALNCGEGSDSG
jgi:hypothetical protein